MVRMQWWAYLLMLMVYICYLLIGAAVFQKLESPFEEKRCMNAKAKVKDKKEEFGNEYFYIFGLNRKFCDGIAKWSKNETASGETRELIKELILKWHEAGCSQDKEDHAWKVIQKNDTLVVEYIKTWKAIAAPVLAKSFNDETLIIRGETVRYVMERTAQFGINNYLALQRDCTQHWNFHNAFFFAGTVATTIGYGNISPSTDKGKLFCIAFTVIGIPYFAYMVGALAELISYQIDDAVKKIQSSSKYKISPGNISGLYVLLGCLFLILIPAFIFTKVEGWSYLDAIYYAVISLTTIGFGDLIPRNQPPESQASHIRNESACLCELINPVPSNDINNKTGLSKLCNPTEWPTSIETLFNMYRVMVFFWILAGLTWLGGVVSMLTDLLNLSVSYQFDFNIFSNNLSFPIIFQRIVRTKPKLIPVKKKKKNRSDSKVEPTNKKIENTDQPIRNPNLAGADGWKTFVPENSHYNHSQRIRLDRNNSCNLDGDGETSPTPLFKKCSHSDGTILTRGSNNRLYVTRKYNIDKNCK